MERRAGEESKGEQSRAEEMREERRTDTSTEHKHGQILAQRETRGAYVSFLINFLL